MGVAYCGISIEFTIELHSTECCGDSLVVSCYLPADRLDPFADDVVL